LPASSLVFPGPDLLRNRLSVSGIMLLKPASARSSCSFRHILFRKACPSILPWSQPSDGQVLSRLLLVLTASLKGRKNEMTVFAPSSHSCGRRKCSPMTDGFFKVEKRSSSALAKENIGSSKMTSPFTDSDRATGSLMMFSSELLVNRMAASIKTCLFMVSFPPRFDGRSGKLDMKVMSEGYIKKRVRCCPQ